MPRLIVAVAVWLTAASNANAEPGSQRVTESPWHVAIAVGYGEYSNPLIQSDDVPIVVDLDIAWFGERAFFDNGDAGYTLHDGDDFTLSVVGRINSDRVFFNRTKTRLVTFSQLVTDTTTGAISEVNVTQPLAIPDRDYAIEAGLELLTSGEWGHLQMSLYHDISGVHEGYEIYANYARPFRSGRWLVEPSFAASYKSDRRNDYFWGVAADEASPALPRYTARSGIGFSGRLMLGYQLTKHWVAVGVVQSEKLPSTVSNSPLVKDESVVGHYVGLQYRF
ncbi:MAG: MipA/OmpV family protein [Gammaproteobacteria bacterium]|nr:MipA/OmpV family protein [Gammaproteobacteria bacterium]NND59280.1 MipA/OmpV family protein [Gammaproteobacteria bacterium]